MSIYDIVKTLHVLSGMIILGTGLGIAWFMWLADRQGDVAVTAGTARMVVLADALFTLPAVIFQPLSGVWLIAAAGFAWTEQWLLWTYGLYGLAGACWLPVLWLQRRLRDLAVSAHLAGVPPPAPFRRYMRLWFALGWPAFTAVVVITYLMVAKP